MATSFDYVIHFLCSCFGRSNLKEEKTVGEKKETKTQLNICKTESIQHIKIPSLWKENGTQSEIEVSKNKGALFTEPIFKKPSTVRLRIGLPKSTIRSTFGELNDPENPVIGIFLPLLSFLSYFRLAQSHS